jgi:hypothetical protein
LDAVGGVFLRGAREQMMRKLVESDGGASAAKEEVTAVHGNLL